jgi:transketolase
MFAAHHRLDNVVAIVDLNGQQALGHTREVLAVEPMEDRWVSFGWDVRSADGHDPGAIREAIDRASSGRPRAVIARTTFGKGVSFMEGRICWHYLPMTDEQYARALVEIGAEHS